MMTYFCGRIHSHKSMPHGGEVKENLTEASEIARVNVVVGTC